MIGGFFFVFQKREKTNSEHIHNGGAIKVHRGELPDSRQCERMLGGTQEARCGLLAAPRAMLYIAYSRAYARKCCTVSIAHTPEPSIGLVLRGEQILRARLLAL